MYLLSCCLVFNKYSITGSLVCVDTDGLLGSVSVDDVIGFFKRNNGVDASCLTTEKVYTILT